MRSHLGHSHPVYTAAYDSTRGRLISGDHAGRVCVWNENGALESSFVVAPGYRSTR